MAARKYEESMVYNNFRNMVRGNIRTRRSKITQKKKRQWSATQRERS